MKTFELGLLKRCCALLCIVTLLTACSNGMLDENTSNRVGEEYVEIEGEKTPNGSQEHVTVDDLRNYPQLLLKQNKYAMKKNWQLMNFILLHMEISL